MFLCLLSAGLCSSLCLLSLLTDHCQLHLLPLFLYLLGLLDYHVLSLHVHIAALQLHNRCELLVIVHLMQVHTIWEHFF